MRRKAGLDMDYRFSSRVNRLQSSAVRDILKLTQGKEIVSFAGGLPAEELFPLDAVRQAADRVFAKGSGSLQYGLTEGFLPLREQLPLAKTRSWTAARRTAYSGESCSRCSSR